MKSVLAFAFALLAAPACQQSSDHSDALLPGPNSLGVTANEFHFEGDTLVAQIAEHPGLDLNGDGDFVDAALEIFDLRSGRETVLPYAANHGFEVDGGFVAFGVTECAQGTDLDGNGAVGCDDVLFVHDLKANRTTNLGLALRPSTFWQYLAQEGPLMAFVVSESKLNRDLDGDGLATRDLVYTYEADIGRLTPLFVATDLRPILEDGRLFVAALEAGYGDKNGDGDTLDQVLLAYDVRSGAAENIGRAVQFAFASLPWMGVEGPLLALMVSESSQGVDQNHDGDLLDTLVEIRDLDSGTILPTNLPASVLTVEGGLVGIYAPEITITDLVGTDYDGDGQRISTVAFFYDWLTGTMTNTRVAVDLWSGHFLRPPVMSNRRAGFVAGFDLNSGQLMIFDARSGTTGSSGLDVSKESEYLDIDPERVICAAFPGTFDLVDLESVVVDLPTGVQHNLELSVNRQELAEGRVLIAVYEFSEGRDLNGDGDQEDTVQQVHDLRTGETFNTGLALRPNAFAVHPEVEFESGRLAVQAHESSQGRDLNGDGDQDDFVLQVVRMP